MSSKNSPTKKIEIHKIVTSLFEKQSQLLL